MNLSRQLLACPRLVRPVVEERERATDRGIPEPLEHLDQSLDDRPARRLLATELAHQDSKRRLRRLLRAFDDGATAPCRRPFAATAVEVGERAPGFTLPDALGREVSLGDLVAEGAVVLTFYRGSWCPYCNLQLKAYQEILDELEEAVRASSRSRR